MASPPYRYLVQIYGPDVTAVRKGLAQAHSLAREAPAKQVVLLTPTKKQLQNGTIPEAFGTQVTATLLRGQQVLLPHEVSLSHATERTFRGSPLGCVILVVYGRSSLLDVADAAYQAYGIVVVPWMESDVQEWIRTWTPHIVGTATTESEERLVADPVVEKALGVLTRSVNLSSGLAHATDRAAAIQLLRMLRDSGHTYDPTAIRAWAVRNGWSPSTANELRDLAQAVLDRRRLRARNERHWRPDLIGQLRREVEEEQDSQPGSSE